MKKYSNYEEIYSENEFYGYDMWLMDSRMKCVIVLPR